MNTDIKTVAEILKSARMEQQLSIKAVADEICVRCGYI